MKLIINKNHKPFKFLISILSAVGAEANMKCTPAGVHFLTSSGGTVATEVFFKPDFFDTYEVTGEEEVFGVMFKDLNTPIQKFNVPLTIKNDNNRLEVHGEQGVYKMPILATVEDSIQELPEFEHELCIENVPLGNFTAAVDMVNVTGSSALSLFTENGKLIMQSVNGSREMTTEVTESGEMTDKTFLTIMLLKPILLKTTEPVKICIQKDKPMVIQYEKDGASMKFIVAPRVDDGG